MVSIIATHKNAGLHGTGGTNGRRPSRFSPRLSGSRLVDAVSRLQKSVMMASSSHLLPSPVFVAPYICTPCKLLRRCLRANQREKKTQQLKQSSHARPPPLATLRRDTMVLRQVWMNEAICLARESTNGCSENQVPRWHLAAQEWRVVAPSCPATVCPMSMHMRPRCKVLGVEGPWL